MKDNIENSRQATITDTLEQPSLIGVSFASATVLALEILLVRIICFTTPMENVQLVLALVMAGLGIAATWTALRDVMPSRSGNNVLLARWCCIFSLSIIICFTVFSHISSTIQYSPFYPLILSSILLLPFIAGGIVITSALSMADKKSIGRVYAADLAGSAIGCLIPFFTIHALGAELLLSVIAITALIPATIFAGGQIKKCLPLLVLAGIASVITIVPLPDIKPIHFLGGKTHSDSEALRSQAAENNYDMKTLYTHWNPVGRIDIFRFNNIPGVPNPYPYGYYSQDDDNCALVVAWDGTTKSNNPISDVSHPLPAICTNAIYHQGYLKPRSQVLIIGVGGGVDVQCALYNEADHIDAVEINPGSLAALRGPDFEMTGKVASSPKVSLHLADGRSFIHGAEKNKYDLIQLTAVDTKQMLASGAKAINENYIYTQEAFDDYIGALKSDGTLSMVSFYEPVILRLASTAVYSLKKAGITNPLDHILIHRTDGIAHGLVVSKTAFTEQEIASYKQFILRRPFRAIVSEKIIHVDKPIEPLLYPGVATTPVMENFRQAIETNHLDEFIKNYKIFNINPVTDDSPYIFNVWRYNNLQSINSNPYVVKFFEALGILTLLSFIFSVIPLWKLKNNITRSVLLRIILYFSCIGFGFLFIEIWLIHIFSMWLGHQAVAFALVLASLLIASAIGSHFGSKIIPAINKRIVYAICMMLFVLGIFNFFISQFIESTWQFSFYTKAIMAMILTAAPGVFMGVAFPAGLAWLRITCDKAVPLAISINFFTSVFATLFVIPIAMFLGYSTLLYISMAIYGIVAITGRKF